jgi:hypothetical protein
MGLGDTRVTNPRAFWLRQTFRRMYYKFKPMKTYWILVVLWRKGAIALTSLLFIHNVTFQLALALLVLFVAYMLQVLHTPFMGDAEMPDIVDYYATNIRKARARGEQFRGISLEKVKRPRFKQTTRLGESASEARARLLKGAADFVYNYNTLEATLLASAVFVCLSGIMFESAGTGVKFEAHKQILTFMVLLTIALSITYGVTVFLHDMFTAMEIDPCSKCRKKKSGEASKRSKGDMAAADQTANMPQLMQNPMFNSANAADVGKKIDGTSLPVSDPDEGTWAAIRDRYKELYEQVQRVKVSRTSALRGFAAAGGQSAVASTRARGGTVKAAFAPGAAGAGATAVATEADAGTASGGGGGDDDAKSAATMASPAPVRRSGSGRDITGAGAASGVAGRLRAGGRGRRGLPQRSKERTFKAQRSRRLSALRPTLG